MKFGGFRIRSTRHTGEFLVHSEVVLEGDCGESLIFFLNVESFLGFNRLMKPIAPTAAGHLAPSKLIHDYDLTIFDKVVLIAFVEHMSAQCRIDVVKELDVLRIEEIVDAESVLHAVHTIIRQGHDHRLFVYNVVSIDLQEGDDGIDSVVELTALLCRTRNNQRRSSLIDEDRIHFVDDRVVVFTLHIIFDPKFQIVA